MNRKGLLITGTHRSGTTWIGSIIHKSQNTYLVSEPFNPTLKNPFFKATYWFQFINTGEVSNELLRALGLRLDYRWLKKNIYLKSTFRQKLGALRLFFSKPKVIIKDPIAFFNSEHLFLNYNIDILILIKHPCAFIASLKRVNWHFGFQQIIMEQPDLVKTLPDDIINDISDFINSKSNDIIDEGILIWKLFYSTALNLKHKYPEWLFYKIEDIVNDPTNKIKEICEKCDLVYNHKMEKYIIETSTASNIVTNETKDIHILKRNSKQSINNWRDTLTEKEIEKIECQTITLYKSF